MTFSEWLKEQDFWKSDAEDRLLKVWNDLRDAGLTDAAATEAVAAIFSTAKAEYGE